MARAYILLGFTFLLVQLHISGDITKYINMRYAYLSKSAAVLLVLLTVVQVISSFRQERGHAHHTHDCDDHCGHHHEEERGWKRKLTFALFVFPIFTGLCLPVAVLDSDIVKAKGFHFPVAEPGNQDPFMQRQFLKPDTSIYYGEEGYRELIEKEKKQFLQRDSISLNDANFLKGMESIYNSPGEFSGKTLSFKGFVFADKSTGKEEYFLFRFGIIHCVADSGVYGMLVEKPAGAQWKDDEWIMAEGSIQTQYYQPFHTTIPVLHVTGWTKVAAPEEQYVYRGAE
ncbi:TIGR03943 family putative permease subunit [Ectobacillus ponti]|uniref:TIGR03943 family protein n=1 Tax=Ectobacillus ponti TaxID=2961894 RepID=A0AA41X8M5_9BACI|nr:TIGR03943 family protein [Ectobacillus ponti]MCP8968900.1 TIGR03943 family protein [Ectobacillus ponti]